MASIDKIIAYSQEVKKEHVILSQRLAYQKVTNALDRGQKLIILIGLRGSGKSTILKNIHKNTNSLYVSGDFLLLEDAKIEEVIKAADFINAENILIDEIQYLDWKLPLKVYSDKSKYNFIISGSYSLLKEEMSVDLKRRAEIIKNSSFSFTEYLKIKGLDLDVREKLFQVLFGKEKDLEKIFYQLVQLNSGLPNYRSFYDEFLINPLPYLFTRENKKESLREIIDAVIFEDIPKLKNIETAILETAPKILYYLAGNEKINVTSIAQKTGISTFSVDKILSLLENAQLINFVYSSGGNEQLKGRKKYLFSSQLMRKAISYVGDAQVGFEREDLFVKIMRSRNLSVTYSYAQDNKFDYLVDGKLFEISGPSKRGKEGIVVVEKGSLEYRDNKLYLPLELLALME